MTVAELIDILEQVPDKSIPVAVEDWDDRENGYLAEVRIAISQEEWADGITRLHLAPANALNFEWHPDVIYYKPSPSGRMVKNGEVIDLYY